MGLSEILTFGSYSAHHDKLDVGYRCRERLTTVSQKAWQGSSTPPVGYESNGEVDITGVTDDENDAVTGSKVVGAAVGMMLTLEETVSKPADTPVTAAEAVALPKDGMSEERTGIKG